LREFAEQHSDSLQRIVIANGGTGCSEFIKHFKDWLGSGELQPLRGHEPSEKAFEKVIEQERQKRMDSDDDGSDGDKVDGDSRGKIITLISALAVSPAAARYTYDEKRDFWDEYVYRPGLAGKSS
jgi:hypothetical protein